MNLSNIYSPIIFITRKSQKNTKIKVYTHIFFGLGNIIDEECRKW